MREIEVSTGPNGPELALALTLLAPNMVDISISLKR